MIFIRYPRISAVTFPGRKSKEVFMLKMKDNLKGKIVAEYKWILWLKLATFCMISAAV